MPRYTLTLLEGMMEEARRLCFAVPEVEGACFLLCGESRTADEVRLLGQRVLPVGKEDYLAREPYFLSLDSPCYVRAAKEARDSGLSLVFVHSHPGGYDEFSEQDDREEPKLQEFFAARVPGRTHGALVLTPSGCFGRVWDGGFRPLDVVRIVGRRFEFHFAEKPEAPAGDYFDRQVRAFGQDTQDILSRLHVGIVGAGGTGSAVAEQLTRFGVGKLSLFDKDTFEPSNVNRVYGSSARDTDILKVEIAGRNIDHIGVGTNVTLQPENITKKVAALALRECDIIFGCTDKEAPRGILCQLATRYFIPFFDTGVLINSKDGCIQDVIGRVTTVYPGEACLFCRGRISANMIRLEMLPREEQLRQAAEGYAPELGIRNPAVVPFTTKVAATAVGELLHRLTGFMGSQRQSTEVLEMFDKSRMSTSREAPLPQCFCADRSVWGSGDSERYLGMWS